MKVYTNNTYDENIEQNKFTAYLVKSVRRKKASYITKLNQEYINETSLSNSDYFTKLGKEHFDFLQNLEIKERLENSKLAKLLGDISERDLKILLMKAIDGYSFSEISKATNLSYKGVSSVYYRLIKHLRRELRGDG